MEYLQGSRLTLDSAGAEVTLYRDGDLLSFDRPGIFGHCEKIIPALFMQNAAEETCVIAYKPINANTCASVDFKRIAMLKLKKGDGSNTAFTARPGTVRKFSLNTFKEVPLTAIEEAAVTNKEFFTSTFTPADISG